MTEQELLSQLRVGQFNVIRDVGMTLAGIVKRSLLEELKLDVQVLMELPPPDELPKDLPSVAISLYHVGKRVGGYLHEPENREVEETNDGTLREFTRRPPLFLDLRYVVTVYARSHRDELSLLGFLLRALMDNPTITEEQATGDSIHIEDRPEIEVVEAPYEELRGVWESFQQPYRPSFACRGEARLDSNIKRVIRRVREAIVDFKKMDG
jgi:hypothetical protein